MDGKAYVASSGNWSFACWVSEDSMSKISSWCVLGSAWLKVIDLSFETRVHCDCNLHSLWCASQPGLPRQGYIGLGSIHHSSNNFTSANIAHATLLCNSVFNMYATFELVKKKWPLTSYLEQSFTECILMNSVTPFHELFWPPCTTILQMVCNASSFWKWSKVPEFGGKVRLVGLHVYCRHSCADRFMATLYALRLALKGTKTGKLEGRGAEKTE